MHDFRSFLQFLDDFDTFSEFDERFDPGYGNFKIVLSKYSDPVMKSVNCVIVKDIEAFSNRITLICEDESSPWLFLTSFHTTILSPEKCIVNTYKNGFTVELLDFQFFGFINWDS